MLSLALLGCKNTDRKVSETATGQECNEETISSDTANYTDEIYKMEIVDKNLNYILYIGESEEDRAWNIKNQDDEMPEMHNSLFIKDKATNQKRMLMPYGKSKCKELNESPIVPEYCYILKAKLDPSGRYVFVTCDPYTYTYISTLCYDLKENTIRYLSDGEFDTIEEDGSVWITGAKTYTDDGAAWFDVRMTPEGKIIEESELYR